MAFKLHYLNAYGPQSMVAADRGTLDRYVATSVRGSWFIEQVVDPANISPVSYTRVDTTVKRGWVEYYNNEAIEFDMSLIRKGR